MMRLTSEVRVRRTVLPQIPAALRAEAVRLIATSLRVGQAEAQQWAPVRTGFLRNQIGVEHRGMEGKLVSRARYSGHVNYGTRYMAARPFFTRGVDAMNRHFLDGWRGLEGRLPRL